MTPHAVHALSVLALLVAATALPAAPQAPTASARAQGLKVTYAPLQPERRDKQGVHSYRARVMSLCVERGETPTPMIDAGMFAVTFEGLLPLPVRDRFRFRVEGKGSFELSVNGDKVLSGALRPGKPLVTDKAVRLQKGDNTIALRAESGGSGDLQLRLLWSGSDFAFEEIAPERWEWPRDDAEIAAGEQLRRGHQLFVERRCARCHLPDRPLGDSAQDELVQAGPDLRAVGARVHPAFLVEWLRDPRAVRHDAAMPRLRFEREADVVDLAAWLATLGQPLNEVPAPAGAADAGAVRFRELGCIACHVPPGEAPPPELLADRLPLDFVPRKWRRAALETFLLEPGRDYEHTRMPDFRLSPGDATALAAFLVRGAQPGAAPRGDVDNGRRVAVRHGCDRCHELALPDTGRRYQEIRALHEDHGCVVGAEDAPDFAFTDDERAALQAFLPRALAATARRSPIDYTARMLPELRCTSCHGMDGSPSTWARLVAARAAADGQPVPAEQDPVAQGVPALTFVGAKLQPGWMERFVTGREESPRPWLHARMPSFPRRGMFVVHGLVRQHGYPQQDEPPQPPDAQLAAQGERLAQLGTGFGCVQCHGVGDKPPVQVFERQGINFAQAADRLRHDYYMRWLMDPLRIDPDARMPKYADPNGKTAFVDVLGGDAHAQFDAIWHWFGTLR
ncbi:MAG: hypothetical protein AB7O97_07340 [Planctomycetota bacterium]